MACTVEATTILLFLAALISIHVHTGDANKGGCQLSDIKTSWKPTGKVVGGKEQYLEIIENKCPCPQAKVTVRCGVIDSAEPVDETKISHIGNTEFCIIAGGKPIIKGSPVTFTYSFGTPQDFPVVSAEPQC